MGVLQFQVGYCICHEVS